MICPDSNKAYQFSGRNALVQSEAVQFAESHADTDPRYPAEPNATGRSGGEMVVEVLVNPMD